MRISKFPLMICAMAICASFISARAQDNPAQAAARAALMEKMNETSEPTNPAPAIAVTPSGAEVQQPPAPMPTNSPVEMQPASASTPAMTSTPENPATSAPASSDTSAQAAARAALMEKMSEATPPVQTESMSPVATNVAVAPMSQPQSTMRENEKTQKEAAAAEKKRAEAEKEAAKAAEKSPVMSQPSANSVNNSGASFGFKPMEAPPLPISADKAAQLQTLDAKYKADQITAEEYFKQREAILGEPDGTNH